MSVLVLLAASALSAAPGSGAVEPIAATPLEAAAPAAAPGSGPDAAATAAALETSVREAIAARWRVDPAALHILWSSPGDRDRLADARMTRLASGPRGWLLVGVERGEERGLLRARAGVVETLWVAARPVATGERLAPADLRAEPTVAWGAPRPHPMAPGGPVGWVTRRGITAGEPVRPPAVAEPPLVAAGDEVCLQWTHAGVEVSLSGVAIGGAPRGGRVAARIAGRPGTVRGIAVAPGVVALTPGGRP